MRMKLNVLAISFLVLLISCEKDAKQRAVDHYMDEILNESYHEMYLPDFEPEHIPALLGYGNNRTRLSAFPVNPISSMRVESTTAGVIALWTIESIRLTELNGDDNEFLRYPSLNPVLRDTTGLIEDFQALQDSTCRLYTNWWMNQDEETQDKINRSALEGTSIIWQ